MLLFSILGMVAIIPLTIWAATGRWRHAVHALREFTLAMAVIVVPVVVVALITSLPW